MIHTHTYIHASCAYKVHGCGLYTQHTNTHIDLHTYTHLSPSAYQVNWNSFLSILPDESQTYNTGLVPDNLCVCMHACMYVWAEIKNPFLMKVNRTTLPSSQHPVCVHVCVLVWAEAKNSSLMKGNSLLVSDSLCVCMACYVCIGVHICMHMCVCMSTYWEFSM